MEECRVFEEYHEVGRCLLGCLVFVDDVIEAHLVERAVHAQFVAEVVVAKGGEDGASVVVEFPLAYQGGESGTAAEQNDVSGNVCRPFELYGLKYLAKGAGCEDGEEGEQCGLESEAWALGVVYPVAVVKDVEEEC